MLRSAHIKVLITQPSFLSNNYLDRLHEIAGGPLGTGEEASISSLPELRSIVLAHGDIVTEDAAKAFDAAFAFLGSERPSTSP